MLQTGARAPDFRLPTLDGSKFALKDALARGPVLVGFVKSDCRTCQVAFPYLQRLWTTYADRPWSMVFVAQDRPEAIQRQVDAHGLTMPIAIEHGPYPVSESYDPDATPTYFWIEPDGTISKVALAFIKKDLNEFAALAAGQSNAETPDIAPDDDGQPPFKPG